MGSYKDVSTILDAYNQLERGRSVARLRTAVNRLRALDPANELLPELEARIEILNCAMEGLRHSASSATRA
ncbi:MAG: hypothetical protein JOZ84_06365 [Methylobacteriaceae bacterium]|nr:hypothetical protein [Methylobacteriaceae bacterium]